MISFYKKIKLKLENKEKLNQFYELFRYGIVGVCTTIINLGAYTFFAHNLNINFMYANAIAWTIAVIFAFFTNKIIVFKKFAISINILIIEFIAFTGSRLFTGVLDMIFMYIGVTMQGFDDFYVKCVVNIFLIFMNYILGKFLVFKK